MKPLILVFLFSTCLYAVSYSIPKETYLSYQEFKVEQEKKAQKSLINAPEHWIELDVKPPLLKKYTVDDLTTLSISTFDGSIGDDLSNVNRWRSQLRLSPIDYDQLSNYLSVHRISDYTVKVIHINDSNQYFLIYWFHIDDQHIFIKIVSSDKIIKESFDLFIENQRWEQL